MRAGTVNPASANLGDEFDRRISRAREQVAGVPEFRSGLTIVVGCGIGRGAATAFGGEEWPNWRVTSCSAYDLITLSWAPDFTPETLWRILDARDVLGTLGVRLHNINGLINLVGWAREMDGHLVPHAQMPDGFTWPERAGMVAIGQNYQRALRHESLRAHDERVAPFIDGSFVPVCKDGLSIFANDRAAPFYASEEPGESGKPMSAYVAPHRVWWADVESPPDAPGSFAYERWRLVGTWLARVAPALDGVTGLPPTPLLWRVIFESANHDGAQPQMLSTENEAKAAIFVEVDRERGVVTTRLTEAWTIAQFHPRNIAEHALFEALVGGIAQLAGTDRATLVAAAVPQIIANEHARHGHAFAVRDFRDNVRPDLDGKVITIAREDDALLRLGLGWRVRERTAGGQVEGWDDCRAFLTDLVRWLEDNLLARLRQFDRRAILAMLLRNHEVSAFDRDVWKRTSAAMLALHGETAETLATITDHEFKLNAVFHATRIVVEMAICACPIDGGATKPGRIDLARLMAQASLLVQVGGWSDAMRWGLMKPELRITPLGDVHADFGFVDAILMPHGRVVSEGRIEQAVTTYGDNLRDRPVEVSVAGRLEPAFEQAWVEQFGATIDQTRILIDWVEQLGLDAGKAVLTIRWSRFTGIEAAGWLQGLCLSGDSGDHRATDTALRRRYLHGRTTPLRRMADECCRVLG